MVAAIVMLVAGVAALFLGRRLFWLFVTVIGFGAGWLAAPLLLPDEAELVTLIVALAGGFVGAMLALVVRRAAVAVAGFALGSYLGFWVLDLAQITVNAPQFSMKWWTIFIIGGGISAVLVIALYDYALIILSSIAGAMLIMWGLARLPIVLAGPASLLIFLVAAVIGIAVQTVMFKQG